jgi:hypothetical protein
MSLLEVKNLKVHFPVKHGLSHNSDESGGRVNSAVSSGIK